MKKETNVVASSIFLFEKLEIKKDYTRLLKLTLKTTLPESFREYTVKLSFNEVPLQTKIDDLHGRIEEIKHDKQQELFPTEGAKKTQIKNILADIKDLEIEMADSIRETKAVEFAGLIEKLEYKDGDTVVTLSVPSDIIADLNDVITLLGHYKVELIRE